MCNHNWNLCVCNGMKEHVSSSADSHYRPTVTVRTITVQHIIPGSRLPLLSPGIKQSPKQINRRPAVVMGAATGPRGPLPASLAPPATKEQTVIPTWLFCPGPHGAMIKTVQVTEGVRWASPPLPSPSPWQQHYLQPSHGGPQETGETEGVGLPVLWKILNIFPPETSD